MTKPLFLSVLAIAAAAGSLIAVPSIAKPTPAPVAEPQGDYKKLVDEKAPAIVSIKFTLKGEGGEQEEETTGAMIEPTGLVLTSNFSFGGMMARMGGGAPTPTDIKVLVGDDTQGVKGKIVARDTELGLAWIQTDDQPSKPYSYIDFSAGAEGKLGDTLYAVGLMGKFFDRVPWVAEARIGALVKKPRALMIPSTTLRGVELSMPVFNAGGQPVGVTTFILPEQEEMEGGGSGMQSAMRGVTSGMILSSSEVVAATARAKETAKKGGAEAAEDKKDDTKATDKPKDGDKPKDAEKPKTEPK